MARAAFHNLGCKVNAYETEAMKQQLSQRGYEIVPFGQEADVYIINTCSVTNIADRKSRQMLHRAKKLNPAAVVVAAGCYAQAAGGLLKEDGCVDIILGNGQKGKLAQILDEYEKSRSSPVTSLQDIARTKEYEPLRLKDGGERTRAFIKVQDGCNQFCSYCIIPYLRGRVRSRAQAEVTEEVGALAAKGVKEVVLTGIHLSSYGAEWGGVNHVSGGDWDGSRLLSLIKAVHAVPGIRRIRLGSLEPRIVTEEFVYALAGLSGVCPHFHLSLQSGCDATLKRMNRHYTAADYLRRCEILRRFYKDPAITTDVIVGFPGETEEEFEASRRFLKEAAFFEMHVFKYSKRAGTRAASMPGQVDEGVKSVRSEALLCLAHEMSVAYRKRRIGERLPVLFEEAYHLDGRMYALGHTPGYVRAALPLSAPEEAGQFANTIREGVCTGFLTDEIVLLHP